MQFARCLLPFFFAVIASPVLAGGVEDGLGDSIQSAEDQATAQAKDGDWVPVPIPLSNPTIGTGLQGVLLYLHPNASSETKAPNATSGLVTMYTDNQSWAVGAFHDGHWADGLYRYRLFAGAGQLNLQFFGVGESPLLANHPLAYTMDVQVLGGQLLRRLPFSQNWYAGLRYLYADSSVRFAPPSSLSDLPDVSVPFRTAGMGLLATYDTRDDNYYPERGETFQLSLTDYGSTWGGNREYTKQNAYYNLYLPLRPDTTLALRMNLQSSQGNAPFFDAPYLEMRGFPRGRYRADNTLSMHAEARYRFAPRWGVVLFAEQGWIAKNFSDLAQGGGITSVGAGLRWQVTTSKKMNLGVDFASSKDDSAVYIRIGEVF